MRKLLLVGNANCGKTTLFNCLTHSDEHVGNWHGVTVEEKEKEFLLGDEKFLLVDIPGIYSLTPFSFEEKVAVQKIKENHNEKILNLCDKNNLRRNLFLTLCLLEDGFDVTILINNIDKKSNKKIDLNKFSKLLNVDIFEIDAKGKETSNILQKNIKNRFRKAILPYFNSNFLQKSVKEQCKIRYLFVDFLLKNCVIELKNVYGKSKIDNFVLNKYLAFPIFFLIMLAVFFLTFFSVGSFLSDALTSALSYLSKPILNLIESFGVTWLYDFFRVAIFGGANVVLSFFPQVVLLFFFLSLLEESGYMARVAFVFDDLFEKIGLSGKGVYSLLMGFGCATSAIMTARSMDDKNAKIKTALACPYMSCSAKIPIYVVVGGAFFGAKNVFVICGLYFLGVIVSIFVTSVLDRTVLKSESKNFLLEFPPYRMVSAKKVFQILWKNSKDFLIKIGSIMISMNVIIWTLSSFSFGFSYVGENGQSILQSLSKIVAPIFVPLGFGRWAIVSTLLSGVVAKELLVSSIAMFNNVDINSKNLISKSILLSSSAVFFPSKASVLSFLVFCLLYTPCISSVAMLSKEVGKKWTFFAVLIQFFVAYMMSFVVYNICFAAEIFGVLKVCLVLIFLLLFCVSMWATARFLKRKKCGFNCGECDKKCSRKK